MQRKTDGSDNNKRIFLEGLKKYQKKGIPILIDGKKAREGQLEKLYDANFEAGGKYFYMSDYVMEESPLYRESALVQEEAAEYQAGDSRGRFYLKEIRFDKVYHA